MSKAKDSAQVQKYRRKLEKQIAIEKSKINPEKLNEIKKSIHKWITRHSNERIDLKDKTVRLFDENEHPAQTQSKYVQHLLNQLQKQEKKTSKPFDAKEL